MGLNYSAAKNSVIENHPVERSKKEEKIIALAGNPNVGKSTVFNALTGLNQHTGNWPGKTVENASGTFNYCGNDYTIVDIPGMYSLHASSAEEEVARDYICFGDYDAVVIVTDATCLERNLNLLLQILEVTDRVVVCVNLLDEAEKKKISPDIDELSLYLGVPVIGASARNKRGLDELKAAIKEITIENRRTFPAKIKYTEKVEHFISEITPLIHNNNQTSLSDRWIALRLLDSDAGFINSLSEHGCSEITNDNKITVLINEFKDKHNSDILRDAITGKIMEKSEEIYSKTVNIANKSYALKDRKLDKLLTSKLTGIPVMLILLCFIFWLTMTGANYPSEILSGLFGFCEKKLDSLFTNLNTPYWLCDMLVHGVFRTLGWVISVMLPPMAIFFPIFTLLEDSGYLPRIAFNMDKFFKKSGAHGKQSLTMCMGFGCNACGVIGCRIIDSPRERMIATVTNNFVPCNGRFPTLIAIITMFFTASAAYSPAAGVLSAIILTLVILLSVFMTLAISKILSKTILKGLPSAFALELPPYRRPKVGSVIVRSVFDRTLFVLARAAAVAGSAGLIIWILSNVTIADTSLLGYMTNFFDPLGKALGLDGVILTAFILGFPANEIVLPIIMMAYMSGGALTEYDSLSSLHTLLVENGWTCVTAICMIIFCLFHFPCSTTALTIKKETGSVKWTLFSLLLPTAVGMILCFIVNTVASLLFRI